MGIPSYAPRYELIIVMPDAGNSYYVNWAEGDSTDAWEDYITQDVIGHVEATYRAIEPAPKKFSHRHQCIWWQLGCHRLVGIGPDQAPWLGLVVLVAVQSQARSCKVQLPLRRIDGHRVGF